MISRAPKVTDITRCVICGAKFPPPIRLSGRPRQYCSDACRRAMARKADQEYRDRRKRGELAPPSERVEIIREPQRPVMSVAWWSEQANKIDEICKACHGPVFGVYVAPTKETVGECAVVAHCRICGREWMIISGRMGVPYGQEV